MTALLASVLRPTLLTGRAVSAPEPWAAPLASLGAEIGEPRDVLVVDGRPIEGLEVEETLDDAWESIRAAANEHWIGPGRAGALLLVAPRPGIPGHPRTLRGALENLARTLSIEWSRYGIRITTILPGVATTDEEIATTLAFLASTAADYWSGNVVELGSAQS
ncbi:MAG: hypothetical protein JHC95_05205 [Solirubrobacteraceae bacterium]|nr:hypothetical protein [Solirubrobacteraceae bacterium]